MSSEVIPRNSTTDPPPTGEHWVIAWEVIEGGWLDGVHCENVRNNPDLFPWWFESPRIPEE